MLLSTFAFASCEEGESVTGISSVEIKDDTVTLKATLDESYASDHSKDKLYVLALSEMHSNGSLKGAEVVAESKAKKSMTFKFSLTDDMGTSRVGCAFVLAEKNGSKYSALTEFAYITNPEVLADKDAGPASTSGIKGIASNDPTGSAILGAEHIVVTADMGKLILADFSPEAVRFNYQSITYFYDKAEVDRLDKLVGESEKVGARVYIRTVLADEGSNAENLLPELDDADAARYVRAFYAFLATRYSASDYIIGNQVNNYGKYCYADDLEAEELERMYSFWARTSNNVLKSVNSSAKIYIPVDNSWKSSGKSGIIGAQAFLSHFASAAKAGGDYDYAVALNLGDGDDLTALLKNEGYNYSKIGAINLSEFSDFIDKSEMRYKSEKRDMIIDGLEMREGTGSRNSAAYYTMAYYTAAANGFDAFVYTGSLYGNNYSRADLYFAFMMCGSSMNSQLSDYTDKLKGANVPNFDENVAHNLKYVQSARTDLDEQIVNKQKDFPVSLSDFETVGDVINFQGRLTDVGSAWLLEADLTATTGGIVATSVPAESIVESGYLGITLNSAEEHTVCLLMRNESSNSDTYTLVGEFKTRGGNNTYYFNLADITEGVDSSDDITVAICLVPNGDVDASVEIVDVSLYGNAAAKTETVIIIIVVVVILLALVGLIVLLVIKRKKKAALETED